MSRLGTWQPETLEERVDRMESLAAIQQFAYRYALALDSRDMDALVELFVPDVVAARDTRGRAALKSLVHRNHAGARHVHCISSATTSSISPTPPCARHRLLPRRARAAGQPGNGKSARSSTGTITPGSTGRGISPAAPSTAGISRMHSPGPRPASASTGRASRCSPGNCPRPSRPGRVSGGSSESVPAKKRRHRARRSPCRFFARRGGLARRSLETCTRTPSAASERCSRRTRDSTAGFSPPSLTTRIYCRPSCPVVPPNRKNMRFYPSAAAAQQAGFRACKRCRPDASPGSPEWYERADVVARAMRLIADGVVDRDGVPGLASTLGYSVRQVERHLQAELGAGPLALARAQRAQTARVLIETTALPMTEVAQAAGFASIRTFNDTVQEVFALCRRPNCAGGCRAASRPQHPGILSLRLPFRDPSARTTSSVILRPPPCRAWRSGAPVPTGGRCGSRTATASWRCGPRPTMSDASCR